MSELVTIGGGLVFIAILVLVLLYAFSPSTLGIVALTTTAAPTTAAPTTTTAAPTGIAGYVRQLSTLFKSPAGYSPINYIFKVRGPRIASDIITVDMCKTDCDGSPICNSFAYGNNSCYFQTIPATGYTASVDKNFATYLKGTASIPTPV